MCKVPMTIRPNTETSDAPAQIGARKGPMAPAWIPATLCVGLLIAAVYLGGRILTAHTHANSPAHADSSVQASVTVQTPAPVETPAPVQATPAAAQVAPAITPQPDPEAPAPP